jgi:putative photosynthetic complex assembly protein
VSARGESETFPRGALLAAATLVIFTLLAVAVGRPSGGQSAAAPASPARAERLLQFQDLDDGSLRVVDVGRQQIVATLEPGTNGFMRGMMRAMVRTRTLHGVGDETPFLLAYGADGRLVLEDPATDSRIPLDAFGPTNVSAFAILMEEPKT